MQGGVGEWWTCHWTRAVVQSAPLLGCATLHRPSAIALYVTQSTKSITYHLHNPFVPQPGVSVLFWMTKPMLMSAFLLT